MPLELYESKYKAKLLEAYRYQYFAMAGGAYIDTAEDNEVVLTATSDEKLMNYISGVEYTDPQSVFKDDSYKEILHRECVEWMVGMGHTPEEAEKLSESLGYEVTGWGIRARMPDETEEIAFVSFSEFDKESLVFFD